jgi:hypothetical protein
MNSSTHRADPLGLSTAGFPKPLYDSEAGSGDESETGDGGDEGDAGEAGSTAGPGEH